jgi:formylmethanofuran dehydrogenase subunit E
MFQYTNLKGQKRWIIPDFIIDEQVVEVKGDHFKDGSSWLKEFINKEKVLLKNNVKILYYNDIKPYLQYIRQKYGEKYLQQFRKKTKDDFKRKIIEIQNVDEIFHLRNEHKIKVSYSCKKCSERVITSVTNIIKHPDMLCKTCRKNS